MSQLARLNAINKKLDKFKANAVSWVEVRDGNGHGSTNTAIRRFTTVVANNGGGDIIYADDSSAGASFTIQNTGLYHIAYDDNDAGTSFRAGISVDSSQLTTTVSAVAASRVLGFMTRAADNNGAISFMKVLFGGSVVRAHTNTTVSGTDDRTKFTITRVY